MKILMICLGNICRSPLAEGILKHLCKEKGLDWEIDSCATSSWHIGKAPDKRSQQVALKNGVDISKQKARQINKADLEHYDLLITMDQNNYNTVKRMTNNEQTEKIHLLLNFLNKGMNQAVIDPYYDDALFEPVFKQIYMACVAIKTKYSQ